MIDSVLKGTGNSRFLKSAVPAGTSWADALAMLQAGTFPIDFNGINTEGFQQVGTPLNKANLLKDATAAQIDLPPSTTPDGMFRALGNTGDLYVWRKTVVTKKPVPEVPGSYTLGTAQRRLIGTRTTSQTNIQSTIKNISRSNSITVDIEGNVSLDNPSTFSVQIAPWSGSGTIRDVFGDYKYIEFTDTTEGLYCNPELPRNTVFLVNPDSTFIGAGYGSGEKAYIYDAQEVIGVPGHPYIPAGTTTTYPVSTNPNAYQEGDDAKEAWYTLGDVVNGTYFLGNANVGYVMSYKTATSLSVSDNGVLSMPTDATSFNVTYSKNGLTIDQIKSYFAGKFVQLVAVGSDSVFSPSSLFKTAPSEILFIPSNSVVTKDEFKNFNIDRYQPVTGYAAVPAGTTIEYLGKLGDKARVQVVSYVGTGTYGESNPVNITANFKMKFLAIYNMNQNANPPGTTTAPHAFIVEKMETTYRNYWGYELVGGSYGKRSVDGKTVSFYGTSSGTQANVSGWWYLAIAIG